MKLNSMLENCEATPERLKRLAERPADCDWCGRTVKVKELRIIKHGAKLFTVCGQCPPPDNPNAMRV